MARTQNVGQPCQCVPSEVSSVRGLPLTPRRSLHASSSLPALPVHTPLTIRYQKSCAVARQIAQPSEMRKVSKTPVPHFPSSLGLDRACALDSSPAYWPFPSTALILTQMTPCGPDLQPGHRASSSKKCPYDFERAATFARERRAARRSSAENVDGPPNGVVAEGRPGPSRNAPCIRVHS
jgi:hypothetical protein